MEDQCTRQTARGRCCMIQSRHRKGGGQTSPSSRSRLPAQLRHPLTKCLPDTSLFSPFPTPVHLACVGAPSQPLLQVWNRGQPQQHSSSPAWALPALPSMPGWAHAFLAQGKGTTQAKFNMAKILLLFGGLWGSRASWDGWCLTLTSLPHAAALAHSYQHLKILSNLVFKLKLLWTAILWACTFFPLPLPALVYVTDQMGPQVRLCHFTHFCGGFSTAQSCNGTLVDDLTKVSFPSLHGTVPSLHTRRSSGEQCDENSY